VRTVLVVSDEPHVPWELIKPVREEGQRGGVEEDAFWGEAFALGRWLRGRPPAQRLSLQRVVVMAGGAELPASAGRPARDRVRVPVEVGARQTSPPPAEGALPGSFEEVEALRCLEHAGARLRVLPARRQPLCDTLERGDFDLLHLACHGNFGGPGEADASAVLLEDGTFSALELSPRLGGALRPAAPLFFFNACSSGRIGFSLTRLGSWGARLVQLGCGGFLGALWPVTDQAAVAFAGAFYALLARGEPVGEAVHQARQRVRERYPHDPSWLAYCCFADPMARAACPH
jgi:CHAT domain-containing protein